MQPTNMSRAPPHVVDPRGVQRSASLSTYLALSIVVVSAAWCARRAEWLLPASDASDASPHATDHAAVQSASIRDDSTLASRKQAVLWAVVHNQTALHLQGLLDSAASVGLREELANSVLEEESGARKTALFIATYNQSPGLARTLLRAGANVTAGRLDEGTTPMHLAAGWLHSEAVVSALLEDARDRAGLVDSIRSRPTSGGLRERTPVYWAAYYGHLATSRRLMDWMRDAEGWRYKATTDEFVLSA